MSTTIQLGHLLFQDRREPGVTGWTFRDLSGWWGGSPAKTRAVERPTGHGSFRRGVVRRSGAAISFEVKYAGVDHVEVEDAYDELAAVGADGPVRLTVTTGDGATWRDVVVEDAGMSSTRNGPRGAGVVDVTADDPRRYADAAWVGPVGPPAGGVGLVWPVVWPAVWPGGGSDGRIVLTNPGKAPSSPVFRLAGGFDDATITTVESGARLMITRPTPEGSVVEVDVAGRRVFLDGQDLPSRWLRFREWEDVPPLSDRTFQVEMTGPVGAAGFSGKVFPAWW